MPTGYLSRPTSKIGARLRKLRKQAGFSQWELAIKLKTQANRVSDWEVGKHVPSAPTLKRIAKVYGITVSELLDGVM